MESDVIKCAGCGSVIKKNAKFCEYCGARLVLGENIDEEIENDGTHELMTVGATLYVMGRLIVTGTLTCNVKKGMKVTNTSNGKKFTIGSMEKENRVFVNDAKAGEDIGFVLEGAGKHDVKKGDTLKV